MYPVFFERKSLEEWDSGACRQGVRKGQPCFIITLNKHDSLKHQCWAMLHEYAHATQWRSDRQEAGRLRDHDDEFGIHWARHWSLWGHDG